MILMLYWMPNRFCSAIRIYFEAHEYPWTVWPGQKMKVPTGISAFRKDIVPIIHSQAARYYSVVRFSQFSQGGHFAIQEKAQFLAPDVRELFRPLRESGTYGRSPTQAAI